MPDNLMTGLMPKMKATQVPVTGSKEYDAVPNMLAFVKSVQNNDTEGARRALSIIHAQKGQQTATDLMFLAKNLQHSKINDIAQRGVENEQNPELKKLYHMVNMNPDIMDKFDFFLPSTAGGGMASNLMPQR